MQKDKLQTLFSFTKNIPAMKKILLMLFGIISISSCKQEYNCDNGQVFKKGTPQYNEIKQTGTYTDYNGQEIHCY